MPPNPNPNPNPNLTLTLTLTLTRYVLQSWACLEARAGASKEAKVRAG